MKWSFSQALRWKQTGQTRVRPAADPRQHGGTIQSMFGTAVQPNGTKRHPGALILTMRIAWTRAEEMKLYFGHTPPQEKTTERLYKVRGELSSPATLKLAAWQSDHIILGSGAVSGTEVVVVLLLSSLRNNCFWFCISGVAEAFAQGLYPSAQTHPADRASLLLLI
uniref:Uncharacterized protein n=1 Tax=Knipowitschia caucasica TaxID=637954 RepID=A0AAV2LBY1_KNICA